MISAANISYIVDQFTARLGDPYVFGGTYSPTNTAQGADCSGVAGWVLEGLINGPEAMSWAHVVSTESWPYDYNTNTPASPGTVGPYGTIAIARPEDAPADAALIVNIMHGGGGESSHMNVCLRLPVQVAGQPAVQLEYMESNGTHGTCTAQDAYPNDSPIWTDHWVLLGPIEGSTPITTPVVPLGLDYAGGRPGGAAIKAAGYDFVVRYLSDGGPGLPGKLLTPAEANDLRANGVDIVSNWETTADMMLGGYNRGVADGKAALAQHFACGGPGYRPIYFSCDFDATQAQQAQIDDYLRGVASVIGLEWTGIYGGYWPVSRALTNGTATWAWQAVAWSGSNVEPRRNLYQRAGFATVGGVQCDVNEAHTPDYGQWSYQIENWDSVLAELMGTS